MIVQKNLSLSPENLRFLQALHSLFYLGVQELPLRNFRVLLASFAAVLSVDHLIRRPQSGLHQGREHDVRPRIHF